MIKCKIGEGGNKLEFEACGSMHEMALNLVHEALLIYNAQRLGSPKAAEEFKAYVTKLFASEKIWDLKLPDSTSIRAMEIKVPTGFQPGNNG